MRKSLILCCVLLLGVLVPGWAADKPAVLFHTGWVHLNYVVKPLMAMGIEVDVCPAGKLAERLATNKYNVVVVNTLSDADRKTVDDFLVRGGGVFVCNPEGSYGRENDWTATNTWLTNLGARPRWELLQDSDAKNLYRDMMGCNLSWSTDISAPVKDATVRGVLTLTWGSTTGVEPPTSFDLSPDWKAVVRGAATHKTVAETRHDVILKPWLPQAPITGSPALLAIREVGKGRLSVEAIRSHWMFTPPPVCPTAEAMLTAGADGKPSDWLRVFANTFRWLADPSLKAGIGGATTPDSLLNPPAYVWDKQKKWDWSATPAIKEMKDQPQNRGLIGARTSLSTGKGTVADYAKAAKAAGLQFIVFLEDSMAMDQAKWDQLVAQCKASSDATFKAIPGLTYEDAQGDHLYAFSDKVKILKPEMLLPDKRLATVQSMRSRAYFDYDNEYIGQEAIRGYWNHRRNFLHFADYKLYNSFPIVTFENGRQIDDAVGEYLYFQGIGGCQMPLAFEMMSDPSQVARRAADGWTEVSFRDLESLPVEWHRDAYSFSGSGMTYITNGPKILIWQSPNRLCEPRGEWWRPDIWEYRVQLRVASDNGLKTVTLFDGDRQVLRRWQPDGAKTFEQEVVLANNQQIGSTLMVEDLKGRKAISATFWNRNLNNEEFFCSDRCNFLGNARLRTRTDGQAWTQVSFRANMGITPSKGQLMLQAAPATNLTWGSPTLPIDGAPAGYPTYTLDFYPHIPGELPYLFAYPKTYLVGPEIGIGQADITLAYDPLEEGDLCKVTPLGHPYTGRQYGWGNAWGSWNRLIPTMKVEGWSRIYAATWLCEGFRLGAYETKLRVKSGIAVPDKGLFVTSMPGELWQYGKKIGDANTKKISGAFDRGTFVTLQDKGGASVLIGTEDHLTYEYANGRVDLYYRPEQATLLTDDEIYYKVFFAGASAETRTEQMLTFAKQFGIFTPGTAGYAPKMSAGKTLDTYFTWHVDAQGSAVQAKIAKTAMPGFLTACIDGVQDNWSVYLLDKARKGANVRALPVRDGRAWAQLDLCLADSDLFLGHPVVADSPNVTLTVNWMADNTWYVEAHNPTNATITAKLQSVKGWTPFTFKQTVTLAPGASQVWTVAEAKGK
jgi:hypothetical protein